ncbi:LysR substrate-binding domain-containing protein [Pararhodobacter oceanensis]|uniref:LysR substrate-binding domain-containing protein n=1 Tax=Pararhodobacter oceanensis TaxID=2172121 RepID=UPI003A945BCD
MDQPSRSDTISPRQVEAFKAVVEAASVTAAANLMHISQPSVSRLLRSLEDSIGFALFERRKGRLVATAEAMLFYDEIQKYFHTMQRLAHTANDIRTLAHGQLRLGSFIALAISITPRVLRRFNQAHPQIHVSCKTSQSRQIVDLVTARFADLGIVDPSAVTSAVRVEREWQFRCVCVLPKGHPLARFEVITAEHLAGETVIGLQREFLTHHPSGAELYAALEPNLRITVHQSIAACAMVSEGTGVAIVDPFTARHYAPHGIIVRPLKATIPFDIRIISSPEAPLSVAAQEFLSLFDAEIEAAQQADPTIARYV